MLPLSFKILTADSVSPTLGRAQLVGGLIAGAIGEHLLLVVHRAAAVGGTSDG